MARHPVLIVGTLFGIFATVMALNEQAAQLNADSLSLPVVALTVGLPAMIAAYRLTRSFHGAERAHGSRAHPPHRADRRPLRHGRRPRSHRLAVGWSSTTAFSPASLNPPAWMYGMFSHGDIAAVLVGNSVVAAAGGTLLGVAAGRWWRFRGAVGAACHRRDRLDDRCARAVQQRRGRTRSVGAVGPSLHPGRLLHLGHPAQ